MKTRLRCRLLLSLLLVVSLCCRADLVVNRSIVELEHGETRTDIVLINSDSTANLYIQVDPYLVRQPGADTQEMVKLSAEVNAGILVTPNKLVIPPGGRSLVRVLNLEPATAEERIYRINFIPVRPPVEAGTSNGDDNVKSRLEVVVAYQVLVILQAQKPKAVHEVVRTGTTAVFRNAGSANYLLTEGEQCNPVDVQDCRPLPDHRVYPANEWKLELPFDGPFNYKIRTPDGMSVYPFD